MLRGSELGFSDERLLGSRLRAEIAGGLTDPSRLCGRQRTSIRIDSDQMTIPDYQTLMRPVLAAVADGSSHRIRDLVALLADKYKLSPQERNQLLPSGTQRVLDNRVGWAVSYMKKAGLVSSPHKGFTQITSVGLQTLKEH